MIDNVIYARRKTIVDPVFGQIKQNSLRMGTGLCNNLLKLYRACTP
jgi:hypothetical protein